MVTMLAFCIGLLGCEPKTGEVTLAYADEVDRAVTLELVTLDPSRRREARPEEREVGAWLVVDERIVEPAVAREFLSILDGLAAASDGSNISCFDPHHALRIVGDDSSTELLVCISCCKVLEIQGEQSRFRLIAPDVERRVITFFEAQGLPNMRFNSADPVPSDGSEER